MRQIFSINPGRSGSKFLQKLLLSGQGVVGGHEQPPRMTGKHLFAVENAPLDQSVLARSEKVAAIRNFVAQHPTAVAYVDTSNMFIKTFADVVAATADTQSVVVIHLRRNVIDVARSFRQLGCWTDENRLGSRNWMFDPTSRMALARRYVEVDPADPTAMIVGYLIETELRGLAFRTAHPNVEVLEVSLPELQSPAEVSRLFDRLGLVPGVDTTEILGVRVHEMKESKSTIDIDVEDDFEKRVVGLLEQFAAAGAAVEGLRGIPRIGNTSGVLGS